MVLKDFGVVLAGPWLGFGWALAGLGWLWLGLAGFGWSLAGFGWLWLPLTGLGWAWLGFVGPSWRDFGGSFQAWGRGKGKPDSPLPAG